ncbi:aspartate aminotransferase family protein [Roseomonas mucosa]
MSADRQAILAEAARVFPGGVMGGNILPSDLRFSFNRGQGSRFWDSEERSYIDYVLGAGAMFLGHAHPHVAKAISAQAMLGTHFFATVNDVALRHAQRLVPLIPCAERIRFTTSGSESSFHAIRLARAFTGRDRVLKFEGAYHGNHDYAQLSTTPMTRANFPTPQPDTAGIPGVVRDLTLIAPFNDIDTFASLLSEHGYEIAAVIIEPIQRILSPLPGFLQAVRELTRQYGIVMIMDEVVTGFRYALGGAQAYFGVTPDLATYGKIIGGGLPVGAVAGRADIMDQADPARRGIETYVYQNGTLQGHPLGSAAGLAVIEVLEAPGVYDRAFAMAEKLRAGLQQVFDRHGMGIRVFGEGPMWHMLFTDRVPQNWRDITATDLPRLAQLELEMLRQGLFILPNARRFISIAHTEADLEQTFEAADRACRVVLGKSMAA